MNLLLSCLFVLLVFLGVSITALWPATVIESHVTTVSDIPKHMMRTAHIFADAVLRIGEEKTDRFCTYFHLY